LLHQFCDLASLAYVAAVLRERSRFRGESAAAAFALRGLGNRLTSGLCPRDPATARNLVELTNPVAAQAE